jgi:universal stress protein A
MPASTRSPSRTSAFSSSTRPTSRRARILHDLTVKYALPAGNARVRHGAPHIEIQDLIKELGVDLLVIGTHGKHGVQLLLGSVANSVIHGVTCDVLAVRIK